MAIELLNNVTRSEGQRMESSMTTPTEEATATPQHQVMQNLSLRLNNAPFWKRVIAFCTDQAIISAGLYVLFFLSSVTIVPVVILFWTGIVGPNSSKDLKTALILVITLILTLLLLGIFHAYFIYFESKKGATPGKKLFGIRVVSVDGKKLSLRQCILREVMRTVDFGLIFPGLIAYFMTDKKQRLGDILAGTWVVHSKEKEKEQSYLYLSQENYLYIKSLLNPSPVHAGFRSEFLAFASNCFLFKRGLPDNNQMEEWRKQVAQYIPNLTQHDIDTKSLLLFFAEYCYQTELNNHPPQGVSQ